jgi:hypothetical protein
MDHLAEHREVTLVRKWELLLLTDLLNGVTLERQWEASFWDATLWRTGEEMMIAKEGSASFTKTNKTHLPKKLQRGQMRRYVCGDGISELTQASNIY